VALQGQDDGLVPDPDPFLGVGFGQPWKFVAGVMILDKQRSSSWWESVTRSDLAESTRLAEHVRMNFPDLV
jgi:hypothetical protein